MLSRGRGGVLNVSSIAGEPAAAQRRVLDELGELDAIVCGLSLGGMVAQQLLVDHPDGFGRR